MIGFNSFSSLFELLEAFPTEQSCIEYLEMLRWGEKVESPFSPGSKVYVCGNNTYLCKDTAERGSMARGISFWEWWYPTPGRWQSSTSTNLLG